jgi:tetratricopeptide (TPR) repeat protein
MDRFDLGTHTRTITTKSPEAQKYFNLGLNWCFGFNHEEGYKCFQRALEHDPDCAMAHWGMAYGAGPFYNLPWRHLGKQEAIEMTALCHNHVARAKSLCTNCSPAEKALIHALSKRYQQPHPVPNEEFDRWDDSYADAMREVYFANKDDLDVAALFAEALITRTPWKLWNVKTGAPAAEADTLEALAVCEHAIAQCDRENLTQHLAILHLHIHITEMSDTPERSMRAADILAELCPDAGHLNHMPGHTYVLCGEYEKARIASEKAIWADDMYKEYESGFNFYTTTRCHNYHLMMYTCMHLGQFIPAIKAAEDICETLTKEALSIENRPQLANSMEGYYSMKMHVLVRFGRWQDIVDEPMPDDPDLYCVSTAMHHYAKGVAHAALKNIDAAEDQRAQFLASLKRVPDSRNFFNNAAVNTLGVGEKMLEGELEYHKGNYEVAFAALRESVQRDDDLEYTEPWAWMHPPRHALAALLAEQGRFEEAEEVYRTDLGLNGKLQRCAQHPRNVWALHGLVECLQKRSESDELPRLQAQLKAASALTDVTITSSCLCRTEVSRACCN